MKKRYSNWLVLAAIFLLSAEIAEAQIGNYRGRINSFGRNKRYLSVGFGINSMNYFGDLAPKNRIASTKISFTRPGFNVHAIYRMGPMFSLRGGFMWGRLYGDDASSGFKEGDKTTLSAEDYNNNTRFIRNQHFRNDIKELSFSFMLDLKKNPRTFISRPDLVPYLTAGIAVFHHNPKAQVPEYNNVDFRVNQVGEKITNNDERYGGVSPGDWVELRPLKTEGISYGSFAFAIPVGAGIRYKVNRYFDVALEVNYRQTFTDYIDDVSGYYQDLDQLYPDPDNSSQDNLGRIMAYRSNEHRRVDGRTDLIEAMIGSSTTENTGESPITNNQFLNFRGYGYDYEGEDPFVRGLPDNDVYLVTNITVTYIIGTSVRNAKFR